MRKREQKIIVGLLMICMASLVAPAQAAGLSGFMVGGVMEHHIQNQQANHGGSTVITDHPVVGAVASGVAGAAAEGMAVHEVRAHPFLDRF